MHDRPTAAELVSAARQYLEGDLLPTLTDARLRFQTLVAANVLAVVERELRVGEGQLVEEWHWLAGLLGLPVPVPPRLAALQEAVREANERLCQRIRQGEYDEADRFRELCRHLRRDVERKLEVANPRYLASFSAPPV
jgi:hypothetical protein